MICKGLAINRQFGYIGDMEARRLLDLMTDGDSPHAVAVRAKVPPKTLDTQLRSPKGLRPEMVVKIARAYAADPVVALVDHGLLAADEVAGVSVDQMRAQVEREVREVDLESMSDEQLTGEVRRLLGEVDRRLAAAEGRQLPEG